MTPGNYRSVLWFLAALWTAAMLLDLREVSFAGVVVGLGFGALAAVAFRTATWDGDRRDGPAVARTDFWVAASFPTLLLVGSLMSYRELPPPGIQLGISAAAGISLALAAWFSWKWRASASRP